MASSLRGQLGVKSGPLAPTSAKLTTQMLVISHMENHYKKINKAKPAIDNRPPKSMVSSQKMRDRRSRKQIDRYSSRPSSQLTYRTNSVEDDLFNENEWEEPEDEEERQVRDIMRTTLRGGGPIKAQHDIITNNNVSATDEETTLKEKHPSFNTTVTRPRSASPMQRVYMQSLQGGSSHRNRPRPMSARSTTSLASNFSQTSRSSNPAKVTYDGDVLSKHAHNFTEPSKPFTPRTLKSNRQSSLKQYKYYTPPPKKKTQQQKDNTTAVEKEAPPAAKPRQKSALRDGDMTQTLTETMLMDMSLQSRDHRQGQGNNSGVPCLDITLDKDHLNWVNDQASRVQNSTE